MTFRALVTRLNRHASLGQGMPFAVEVGGVFAGQVTVNNIVRGLGPVRVRRLLARS